MAPLRADCSPAVCRHAFLTALDCASRRLSRSRSAMSIPSACCCASSAATGQGSSRDVVAAAAPTAARLVAGGSAAQPAAAGRSRLFPGRDSIAPLSARQLCRAVRAAAQAAGMSPHTLRHSFTTRLFEQDVGIRVIHTLLSHAKLDVMRTPLSALEQIGGGAMLKKTTLLLLLLLLTACSEQVEVIKGCLDNPPNKSACSGQQAKDPQS